MTTKDSKIFAIGLFVFILIDLSYIFKWATNGNNLFLHIISLSCLLACYLMTNTNIRLYKGAVSVSFYLISTLFLMALGREELLISCFTFFLLPPLFAKLNDEIKNKRSIYVWLGVIVFLINGVVTIAEYNTGVNFFYFDMDKSYAAYNRFRASGIWGHPLYTALINGISSLFILSSNLNSKIKMLLWIFGVMVSFCYDARASSVALILCSFYILYASGSFSKKNFFSLAFLLIISAVAFNYLSTSDLGGKLFNTDFNNFEDDSSEARIVAFKILFDLSPNELFFGVDDQFRFAQRYGVLCAENSVVALILCYGLPIMLMILYVEIKSLFYVMKDISRKYQITFIVYWACAGIPNQSLSSSYLWLVYIVMFMLINPITNRNNKSLV